MQNWLERKRLGKVNTVKLVDHSGLGSDGSKISAYELIKAP